MRMIFYTKTAGQLYRKLIFLFTVIFLLLIPETGSAHLINTRDTLKSVKGNKTVLTIKNEAGVTVEIIRLKDNLREGAQEKYSKDGQLLEKYFSKKGNLEGAYVSYDVKGNIREKKNYKYDPDKKKSVLEGSYESYYNGSLQLKCGYKNDLLQGKYTKYRSDGKLETVTSYENNLIKGQKLSYNYLGNLTGKANYAIVEDDKGVKKSVMDGKYVYYDNAGHITEEGEYKKGNKEGVHKKYYNGELSSVIHYKNNKRHGYYSSYDKGKLKNEGNYYEEILYKDVVLKNVNDGNIRTYFPDGQLERNESYTMGKKNGVWEYYYPNGKLKSRAYYEDNLQSGMSETWDAEGNKQYQVNYKIIDENGVKKSVMDGKEMRWEKGVLVFERNMKNGVEVGQRISYHPNGSVKSKENVSGQIFNGDNVEYYPNGNIKSKSNYKTIKDASGKEKSIRFGWQYYFDPEGKLTTKYLYDEKGEVNCSVDFNEGIWARFSLKNTIDVYYFPDGKVLSYAFYDNRNRKVFEQFYYWNGTKRKTAFQNPENELMNYIDFTSKGEILSVYSDQHQNPEDKKPGNFITNSINEKVRNGTLDNKFFTDSIKNGEYALKYGNGELMAVLHFKNDLPHGEFVFYDVLSKDTLSYKSYQDGVQVGYYIDKFAGKNVINKGELPGENGIVWKETFYNNGLPYRKEALDANGKVIEQHEYYQNGGIKSKHNLLSGNNESYDEKGNLISLYENLDESTKLMRYQTYFPGSKQLKQLNFMRDGLRDSIYETYYESGKLSYRTRYKAGKMHGLYEYYAEDGSILRKGKYVNDLQEGLFLIGKDGVIDSVYYHNGRMEIKAPKYACQCYDTLQPLSSKGFAPWIKGLLEYPLLAKFLPDNIIPYDSLNYKAIFYTGMQNSSSRDGGFYTMNLMLFKELSFSVPSDEQLKICLNPCMTQGYQSRMQISVTTSKDENDTYAWMDPKRISIELPKSPLKSADKKQKNFTGYFDVKSVDLNQNKKLDFNFIKPENSCFSPGVMKDFLNIEIHKAYPLIFKNPRELMPADLQKLDLSKTEIDNFFGLNVREADLKFKYTHNGQSFSVGATSDFILAGGNFVSGVLTVSCTKNDAGIYNYVSSGETILLDEKNIRKEWLEKGFSRMQFEYDEKAEKLSIYFFVN